MSPEPGSDSADAPGDALAPAEIETLEMFRRSPHPYLRHREELRKHSSGPSNASSPRSRTPLQRSDDAISDEDGRKRRRISQSPSESGTEADDEGYSFIKALPAPPLRLHKGLRDTRGSGKEETSPLLTPTQIDDEGRQFSDGFFEDPKKGPRAGETSFTDEETRVARQKYRKRRWNELLRRTTETALLAGIGILAVQGCGCWEKLLGWNRVELVAHTAVVAGALCLYPLRLFYYSWRKGSTLIFRRRIHLPAAFDPATILYPPVIPVLISISLFESSPKILLPNILLSLAALPPRVIPFRAATLGYSSLHWLVSILPLIAAEHTDIPSRISALKPYKLKLPPPTKGLNPELLVTLFPLHQALLPPLYYLTTTSLLPAELHLLSIGLINLLIFSESPQSGILNIIMWMGGLGLFVLCGKVLKWGVALARIPRWRLRRAGQVIKARQSFLRIMNDALRSRPAQTRAKGHISDSDADEDEPFLQNTLQNTKSLKLNIFDAVRNRNLLQNGGEAQSAVEPKKSRFEESDEKTEGLSNAKHKRRNTLPILAADNQTSTHRLLQRKRSKSIAQAYLSLTPTQAAMRKWLYAGYFYLIVVLIILGPVRTTIGKTALHGHEPFGWAIGYLFGNLPRLRWEVINWNLDWWIPLPAMLDSDAIAEISSTLSPAEYVRQITIGAANTRLLLCVYCAGTILVGLISVLSLSSVVEVDTRRKVFHGTMVAMLLPTIYIDPCFVALALALVLAIFLILDLIRASQLPPLSKPIARFLTPYVDGRDLRGPVVVSHIFLLIGCAIPLWLSLAGVTRTGDEPWQDWDVQTRDVSMVAGVVCVGMGDAAASLIGRRYGRRKWPWAGGKSLEGSLAFAVAVTVGLVFGRAWLHFGWSEVSAPQKSVVEWARDAGLTLGKAAVCAVGASLNEAVLTGGNDNVIVPVILWVLVRGVRL